MHQPRPYTPEEDAFIIDNFTPMSVKEIIDKIKDATGSVRTEGSIRQRIFQLREQGLLPSERKPQVRYLHRYGLWTAEQDAFLRENFRALAIEDIAFVVERTVGACLTRASRLGLTRLVPAAGASESQVSTTPALGSGPEVRAA